MKRNVLVFVNGASTAACGQAVAVSRAWSCCAWAWAARCS